jgi:hypothetical protein
MSRIGVGMLDPCEPDRGTSLTRIRVFIAVGILLAGTGTAWLVTVAYKVHVTSIWPYYVIAFGVYLALDSLIAKGEGADWFFALGSAVVVAGLILLYQNHAQIQKGHSYRPFDTWAYAWPLVVPGALGLALVLLASFPGRRTGFWPGVRLVVAGGALFGIGTLIFEAMAHLTPIQWSDSTRLWTPAILALFGTLVAGVAVFALRKRRGVTTKDHSTASRTRKNPA